MKKKGSGTAPAPIRIGIGHESRDRTTRNTGAYLKKTDVVNRILETQTRLPRTWPPVSNPHFAMLAQRSFHRFARIVLNRVRHTLHLSNWRSAHMATELKLLL